MFRVKQYVKHLVFKMAKSGWNVVVSNHRGLGGVSITVSTLCMNISIGIDRFVSAREGLLYIIFIYCD